jgi:hypothetical protein
MEVTSRLLQSEPLRRCQLDECQAACCLHGVWVDQHEVDDILEHASIVQAHMPAGHSVPDQWFHGESEDDPFTRSGKVIHTSILPTRWHYGGTACIFLRSDYKCALQVAAEQSGLPSWQFKPFYCILHPLELDDEGHITLDETQLLAEEPASCLRTTDELIPLVITFESELRYFLGDQRYDELLNKIEFPHKP